MNYLICKNGSESEYKIVAQSRAKSLSYLKSEWRRVEKMFPEYHSFKIVSAEEFEAEAA